MKLDEASTWFTLRTAADETGVSRVTIRRYLDAGRFPNARREAGREDGRWEVSVEDLLATGLRLRSSDPDEMVAPLGSADTVSVESLLDVIATQADVIRQQAATIRHMADAIVAGCPRPEE